MKTNALLKTITVAGAVAATFTLSACDMHVSFGQESSGQEQESTGQQQGHDQDENNGAPGAQDQETSTSSSSSTSNGTTSSGGPTDSGSTTENDDYQGPRIGEDGVELDQDGNGKIPAGVLEDDIANAYAKQGTTVDEVDCYGDLRIYSHRGSQSCTVTAAGKKNYGTVKITSATQSGIGYSLEFPTF